MSLFQDNSSNGSSSAIDSTGFGFGVTSIGFGFGQPSASNSSSSSSSSSSGSGFFSAAAPNTSSFFSSSNSSSSNTVSQQQQQFSSSPRPSHAQASSVLNANLSPSSTSLLSVKRKVKDSDVAIAAAEGSDGINSGTEIASADGTKRLKL